MPPRLAFLYVISIVSWVVNNFDSPSAALLVAHARELDLYAVHAVDTVNKQDQDEDESYLNACQMVSNASAPCVVPSCHIVISLLSGSRR